MKTNNVVFGLLASLSLVGCGGGSSETGSTTPATSDTGALSINLSGVEVMGVTDRSSSLRLNEGNAYGLVALKKDGTVDRSKKIQVGGEEEWTIDTRLYPKSGVVVFWTQAALSNVPVCERTNYFMFQGGEVKCLSSSAEYSYRLPNGDQVLEDAAGNMVLERFTDGETLSIVSHNITTGNDTVLLTRENSGEYFYRASMMGSDLAIEEQFGNVFRTNIFRNGTLLKALGDVRLLTTSATAAYVCSKENQLIAYDKEADTTTTTSQYCSEKPISEEVGDTVNFFFPEQSEVVQYNKTTKAAVKASLSAQTATLKDGKLTYADGERIVRVSVEALLAPALSLAGDEEVLAEGVDAFTLAAGSDRVFFAGLDLTSGSFATGSVSSAGAVAKEEASEKVLEILEMKK